MAGISSSIPNLKENGFKYNGKEFHSKEFSDQNGLNWYFYGYREFDSQIGRFFRIDPISEEFRYLSTFQYASNNPILNIDIDGLEGKSINELCPSCYDKKNDKKQVDNLKPKNETPTLKPHVPEKRKEAEEDQTNKSGKGTKGNSLFGKTITTKDTQKRDIINSNVGDKVTITDYAGIVTGSEGSVLNLDVSTDKNKIEGGSVTVAKTLSLGINTDLSVSGGVSLFGYDIHASYGIGAGFGKYTLGIGTNGDGKTAGRELTVQPGLLSAVTAVVAIFAPELLPAAAPARAIAR